MRLVRLCRGEVRWSLCLALGASLANALTSVFQRMGVEDAPATPRCDCSLHRVRRAPRVWLLGFALMIVSFMLQAIALHFGRLSQVQPILTTELVFLVAMLAIWFGFPWAAASGSARWR